eukprot:784761-Pyramimonas_sp.AAC.2
MVEQEIRIGERIISPPVAFNDTRYSDVCTSGLHVCAIELDSKLMSCYGWNANGQALPPPPQVQYTRVACGYMHTCAIRYVGTSIFQPPDETSIRN